MRATLALCVAISLAACGGKKGGGDDDDMSPDACVGIECDIVDCQAMSLPPTSISGTVFAPNGTLPLNGVNVYVPRDPLPPFVEGATCDRCQTTLPGSPVAQSISGADGKFQLDNVPVGSNINLVVTTGKWRRVVTIPTVSQCMNNMVGAADTRLPKNKSEGDIPKIALTTGSADSLECLVHKLGIDDAEVTTSAGNGRVHFYHGNGVSKLAAGGTMTDATPFWATVDSLKQYDIVFLSCEGDQNPNTKPQAALDAMKAYADLGGRVFASHWHNIWVGGNFKDNNPGPAPQVWKDIATWTAGDGNPGDPIFIDEVSNPKGPLFADWMLNVGGSTVRDQIKQTSGTERRTALTVDTTRAERWVQTKTADSNPAMGGPQMFQFTTPNEVVLDERCGKVVFTDMHVSGGPRGGDYPDCGPNDLSAQEKALAFMFFDIASCVGGIF